MTKKNQNFLQYWRNLKLIKSKKNKLTCNWRGRIWRDGAVIGEIKSLVGVLLIIDVVLVVCLVRVDLERVVDPELGDLRPLLGLLLAGRRRGLLLVRAVYHHGLHRLRAGRFREKVSADARNRATLGGRGRETESTRSISIWCNDRRRTTSGTRGLHLSRWWRETGEEVVEYIYMYTKTSVGY